MKGSPQRESFPHDLRVQAASVLALASWAGMALFFLGVPLLYLSVGVSWPMLAGSACVVGILFVGYHLVAQTTQCLVCNQPVFGGGVGHKRHPNAQKLFGVSYSRKVAWDVLTKGTFQCMHCQARCRCRSQKAARHVEAMRGAFTDPAALPMATAEAPMVPLGSPFHPNPAVSHPEAPGQVFHPTPITMPDQPLSPQPLEHPERTPWAHHGPASPFLKKQTMKTDTVPTPTLERPTGSASVKLPPARGGIIPSHADLTSKPMNVTSSPQTTPAPMPTSQTLPGAGSPFGMAAKPQQPNGTAPLANPASAAAPAPAAPTRAGNPPTGSLNGAQVEQIVRVIEETQKSMAGLFEKMIAQLRTVTSRPAPAVTTLAAPPAPSPVEAKAVAAASAAEPSAVSAGKTSSHQVPPPIDPRKAEELDAVMAQAFAQVPRPQEIKPVQSTQAATVLPQASAPAAAAPRVEESPPAPAPVAPIQSPVVQAVPNFSGQSPIVGRPLGLQGAAGVPASPIPGQAMPAPAVASPVMPTPAPAPAPPRPAVPVPPTIAVAPPTMPSVAAATALPAFPQPPTLPKAEPPPAQSPFTLVDQTAMNGRPTGPLPTSPFGLQTPPPATPTTPPATGLLPKAPLLRSQTPTQSLRVGIPNPPERPAFLNAPSPFEQASQIPQPAEPAVPAMAQVSSPFAPMSQGAQPQHNPVAPFSFLGQEGTEFKAPQPPTHPWLHAAPTQSNPPIPS